LCKLFAKKIQTSLFFSLCFVYVWAWVWGDNAREGRERLKVYEEREGRTRQEESRRRQGNPSTPSRKKLKSSEENLFFSLRSK